MSAPATQGGHNKPQHENIYMVCPIPQGDHKLAVTAEELQAEISPIHFDATFEVEGLVFPPTSMYRYIGELM